MRRVGGGRKISLAVTFARRRRLLLAIAACVWTVVWVRTLQLQVLSNRELSLLSLGQSDRRVRLTAPRGEIIDRQGRLLAINVAVRSYFAYPDRESSLDVLARAFAPIRACSYRSLTREWADRSDRFTWMVRRCGIGTAEQIDRWKLPGVYPTWEYERAHPIALPGIGGPLGFVNDSMAGAAGLEAYYNDVLAGRDGEGCFLADANGRRFVLDPVAGFPPVPGARLRLCLDARWQSILAEELAGAVDKWRAKSGMALLMDPFTGGILAMADVDPARPKDKPILKSRLVSDVFEPGSTFKVVPFAAALSDGVVYPGRHFDGGMGAGVFSGRTIRDDKRHGVIPVSEAFMVSSNVITGRIANRLEPGRLDFWARRFGFGEKTGIDLPAESQGRIARQKHSEFNVATRSIGHGISVTPLQLAAAYAAVANGGYLVRPHLVAATESADGDVRPTPIEAHRILRPEVASLLADFMRGVVREGTARTISDSLYPIAGKTGTAEKPNPVTGSYDKNKFMASFVGFYPADRPRVLGLVVLDEPEPIHYGGFTAAPVLLNTIRRAAASGEVPTDDRVLYCVDREDSAGRQSGGWSRRLIDAVGPLIATAEARDSQADLADTPATTGELELDPPAAGPSAWDHWLACASSMSSAGSTARPLPGDSAGPLWPDVRGLPLRSALNVLRELGAKIEIAGKGQVALQEPAPDVAIGEDRRCRLTLR
ncbi:MAG: penicillin-binding transpeptidase domain-containing protein [Candidatus Zixiibacteriota bacterium]